MVLTFFFADCCFDLAETFFALLFDCDFVCVLPCDDTLPDFALVALVSVLELVVVVLAALASALNQHGAAIKESASAAIMIFFILFTQLLTVMPHSQ
jgi:hypothetical protein